MLPERIEVATQISVDRRTVSAPAALVAPDLALCDRCHRELFDLNDLRYRYPYISCTDCGPRYSIVRQSPCDRPDTTMRDWAMDSSCSSEYHDPTSHRFHAQAIACPHCGPQYYLRRGEETIRGDRVFAHAARLLGAGEIVALKGLGGYHLVCDAANPSAVLTLRDRKYRKEKPFAVMVRDIAVARRLAILTPASEAQLTSPARPVVLAPARTDLLYVSPDNCDIGLMLPYSAEHWLLFDAGAPEILVMTGAKRSSEPIVVDDAEALDRLEGIADAFLIGERPIARRLENSVVRTGVLGPVVLRRGRGLAPAAVAQIRSNRPILALGADRRNSVTLVVDGQAYMSQDLGNLENYQSFEAFDQTIFDLLDLYRVNRKHLLVVHDLHPEYRSTAHAMCLGPAERLGVQHHRAHIASVLAERGALDERVLGVCWDGGGFGDDGSDWGGEFLVGSVSTGFQRIGHLRPAVLVGGDSAVWSPEQSAAGFLHELAFLPNLSDRPFNFSARYRDSVRLLQRGGETATTNCVGRLFDTVAALLGFNRAISFEGQAASWLEHVARRSTTRLDPYPFPYQAGELDFRPLLTGVLGDRIKGRGEPDIARAFHAGLAQGMADAVAWNCRAHKVKVAVVSGGVFQNQLLLADLVAALPATTTLWTNQVVPPNDGGISLGQAALAAFATSGDEAA